MVKSCRCPVPFHGSLVTKMSPGRMLAIGKRSMKWITARAMELTCPGVPVTAWAIIWPRELKTPADTSPASRVEVLKPIRISVCACSSTTEIRRSHMICWWITRSASASRGARAAGFAGLVFTGLVFKGLVIGSRPRHYYAAKRVDARGEAAGHHRRGLILDDQRGSLANRTDRELVANVERDGFGGRGLGVDDLDRICRACVI